MKCFLPFFAFLSLLLLADTIAAARKDAGEYWRAVMKDQPMPEALQGIVRVEAVSAGHSGELKEELIIIEDFERPMKLEEDEKKSTFADDIEPRPNISAYGEDGDLKGKKPSSFAEDIEPRPNISAYGGDGGGFKGEEKPFASDFEQEPNIAVYHG
ncbi:hypothetical protein HRI_004358500 [Hibiscus trionum]|uniref:Organ-specific protein P4 n=1 Tax=Hibiscus trionum TaxID=183268 RepID=A0A9W7MJG5_HIBTR|nr:hypothetical protein HRI_004358500 [Hibiscus trionum]